MHLKSLTIKGFKSFPDRTRLDFGSGVSVVVGPNGSGKSNITDAVLWAMGEQSPGAVRGQSMQDVIFGGGRGVQARSAAEVEIVLDNSDHAVELPFAEVSIVRRLDRSGEGEYRLNGARCRLADVIEVLSDTGLGKETHSVISQGRVEQIVMSKARERRMLIEEAAGLGKHRRRRRRAQLKLERTQENLDRALDVEREARARLRPLKRQAEAAELHARLERQMLEARLELAREALRARRVELSEAEERVRGARHARAEIEARLEAVVERRGAAERALAQRADRHEALAARVYRARSALERLELRREQAEAAAGVLQSRMPRVEAQLAALEGEGAGEPREESAGRVAALEAQLAEIEREREQEVRLQTQALEQERSQAQALADGKEQETQRAREALERADQQAQEQRERLRECERAVEAARRHAASVGAELSAINQFLRTHSHPLARAAGASGPGRVRALGEVLRVREGCELALAAALGGRLDAALAADISHAEALLDGAGPDGAVALLAGPEALEEGGGETAAPQAHQAGVPAAAPPVPGAVRLLELLSGAPAIMRLASRLLADAWLVERLDGLPAGFAGVAVTRTGRVWFGALGEVRQLSEGGADRVLAKRNERERAIAASEEAARAEHAAASAVEEARARVHKAEEGRERAETSLREAQRRHSEALEEERRLRWLIEQRSQAPDQGPLAVRVAQLEGELAAERRQAERAAREQAERAARLQRLRAQLQADRALAPHAERLARALERSRAAVGEVLGGFQQELESDRSAGEEMAGELRACAAEEAEIQALLRREGEAVTAAEVAAQRIRDQAAEAAEELREVSGRLELDLAAIEAEGAQGEPLDQETIDALHTRLDRLRRRREQLGPVNPLAQEEYAESLAHVEELEGRRADLENALRELRAVIREADRQIHETFEQTFQAAARNFEELASYLFPGGGGRLRLVSEQVAPRPVLGGEEAAGQTDGDGADGAESQDEEEWTDARGEELEGVEIEITPAGKSTKRLSLLSGGEKSMTALAFLFAVFLARPCPFYILDEVEAALDDLNLDRFISLLRRYASRAQFIVITHQRRTMEAADSLYGVSMGGDGVSKVISRRLPPAEEAGERLKAPEAA